MKILNFIKNLFVKRKKFSGYETYKCIWILDENSGKLDCGWFFSLGVSLNSIIHQIAEDEELVLNEISVTKSNGNSIYTFYLTRTKPIFK